MAITAIWQRFGREISAQPHQTLAAFLGHADSIAALDRQGLGFPAPVDFANDPAYDPNPHGLGMSADRVSLDRLTLSLMTWGKAPVLHMANACSHLQCAHQSTGSAALINLRDAAASALQCYLDDPADQNLARLRDACKECLNAYQPYEDSPDSDIAQQTWVQLGAPWLAAEAACGDWSPQKYDGAPPPESQSTWIRRNAVWPQRAAETAAYWSSCRIVRDAIMSTALDWATRG